MSLQYCQNCGAELRCADDIGDQWVETERRPGALIGLYVETEIEIFLCHECAAILRKPSEIGVFLMSKSYIECHYYRTEIDEFDGCSALDAGGDDEECDECPYRLKNVKAALKQQKEFYEVAHGEY